MPRPPHPDAPWARAVIRDGRLTLNRWSPRLMSAGPVRQILAPLVEKGIVLADLFLIERADGGEDLRVAWVPDGAGSEAAADLLVDWAQTVGYRAVWLPDRWVDLGEVLFAGGRAAVVCPTCDARWDDAGEQFWSMVRSNGYFPASCPVCNGSLPEWEYEPAAYAEPIGERREVAA